MELEVAMELNKKSIESLEKHGFKANAQAVTLGNEALKYIKEDRELYHFLKPQILPGETKGKQNG